MIAYGPFIHTHEKPPKYLTEALAELDEMIAKQGPTKESDQFRKEILEMLEAYK